MEERSFISASPSRGADADCAYPHQATLDALKTPVALLAASGVVLAVNDAWRAADREDDHGENCPVGENYLDWCRLQPASSFDDTFTSGVARVLAGAQKKFERNSVDGAAERQVLVRRIEGERPARFLLSQEMRPRPAGEELEDRVLAAQFEERQRLAVELHDSLGQNFVCMSLGLARLRQLASPESDIAGVITDMAESLQQAHAEIRTLSFLLQPPWLDERGAFEKAICNLVSGFARRAGLQASVEAAEVPNLCHGRQLTLFRILQEALVNVHRHARAAAVEVELSKRGRYVVLKVSDNGRGMHGPEGAPPNLGVGLVGMRARLKQWGGDLAIVTGEDGTTLTAKISI